MKYVKEEIMETIKDFNEYQILKMDNGYKYEK